MEKRIALGLVLVVWILLDPWFEKHIGMWVEKDSRRWWSILGSEPVEKWMHARYKPLRKLRFVLIGVMFSVHFEWMLVIVISALIITFKWPYLRLRYTAKKRIDQVRYQFPIYLRQLQVLLQNNTVVKTIELSLEYVPELMRNDIVELHRKLLLDPMELNHYLDCMKHYELPEVTRAMKWLFRYQSIGYQDAYRQFNRMINSTSKWLRQSRLESKDSQVHFYQWMGLLPLFGVTLVFITAMMSVALSLFERG